MNHSDGDAFIIGEAGINHGGSFEKAKKLIDIAVKAQCTAVKFQSFSTDHYMSVNAISASYIVKGSRKNETFYQLSKRFEMSHGEQRELFNYSKRLGMPWISSFFDEPSLNFLAELGVKALKVASGEMTNFPLLKKAAKTKIPLIVSTGMASIQEIEEMVKFLQAEKVKNLFLMHCVSWYPAKVEDMNIKFIDTLFNKYKIPVGLSDHTLGIATSLAARARGVKFFEKHFTYSKAAFGPDHAASIDGEELRNLVVGIEDVGKCLGTGKKTVTPIEYEQRKVHRKSIVAHKAISAGSIIKPEMLAVKRPGLGIEPKYLGKLAGYKAVADIVADQVIEWSMVKKSR
jgi:sialic acid synthase SpsE